MSAVAIIGSTRFAAGCLGMGAGWIFWSALRANLTAEVSAATFESVRSSVTFGFLADFLQHSLLTALDCFYRFWSTRR